ncbi:MAG: spermidine synthase family protein, partial [Candidatus Xenobia bacterium]
MQRRALVLVMFVLSGASGLIFQVVWSRDLALVFGSTLQSVSTTASAFMLGLGLGAWTAGQILQRVRWPFRLYAAMEGAVGLTGLGLTLAIPHLTSAVVVFSHVPAVLGPLRFVLIFALLLVPTTAMGTTLPILTHALVGEDFGARLSWLYGINTLGAAAGAWLTDFAMVPAWGVRET